MRDLLVDRGVLDGVVRAGGAAACPKGIDIGVIARMNREHLTAALRGAGRRVRA